MKKFFGALIVVLTTVSAFADVYVPYGRWTRLPYCGGETRLECPNTRNPRENNQCEIQFRNSYGCSQIKLYVGLDFHPTSRTVEDSMKGSFWVNNNKVGIFTDSFRTYMHSGPGSDYEQVTYQFNH